MDFSRPTTRFEPLPGPPLSLLWLRCGALPLTRVMEQAAPHRGIACSRGPTVVWGTIIQRRPREAVCGGRNLGSISPPPRPWWRPSLRAPSILAFFSWRLRCLRPGRDIKLPQFRTGDVTWNYNRFSVKGFNEHPAVGDGIDDHQLTAVNSRHLERTVGRRSFTRETK